MLSFSHYALAQDPAGITPAELRDTCIQQLLSQELPDSGTSQLDTLLNAPGSVVLPSVHLNCGANPTAIKIARDYASELTKLAKHAAEQKNPTLAFRYLNEAAFFDEQSLANKIANVKVVKPRVLLATTNHPKLPWKRDQYFRVTTDNYQVVTQDRLAGVEISKRLEHVHAVWRQIFFACWSTNADLVNAWRKKKPLTPRRRTRLRVILFKNRGEYVAYLQPKQPRIGITLGFYDVDSHTSYFFAGADASPATQIHEVTHQLFQEVQRTSSKMTMKHNFWVIEGIALYMESMQRNEVGVTFGGWGANRLQFARYRNLQEGFYVPLADLVSMGRDELQQDPRIRRIYSQSAGLTQFLMEAEAGKYRAGLIQYLRAIYQGRDGRHTLASILDVDLPTLDQQYKTFLNVNDQDLVKSGVAANSLKSLCLGHTQVTDLGLRQLTSQGQLDWLDLAFTPATDSSLEFIKHGHSLRQLNLEHTQVTDATTKWLQLHPALRELDLSETQVTDRCASQLARLSELRELWLNGTSITDASIEPLSKLKGLQRIGLTGTQVTPEGRQQLKRFLPDLVIQ